MLTYAVVLEYCGGTQTDQLHQQLTRWNPRHEISVLDNASPRNRCSCITTQNPQNSYIGGGVIDCLNLAERSGATYLFLVMNDVQPVAPLEIQFFEETMEARRDVVQMTPAVTPRSGHPWMTWQRGGALRQVPHCDIYCAMFRLDFVRSFGGFPNSTGAWGYDWELAYQARRQGKVILVSDRYVIAHPSRSQPEVGNSTERYAEMRDSCARDGMPRSAVHIRGVGRR